MNDGIGTACVADVGTSDGRGVSMNCNSVAQPPLAACFAAQRVGARLCASVIFWVLWLNDSDHTKML